MVMRTRHKIYQAVLIATFLLVVTGCEKFLDKELQGSLTQQSFPQTPEDALLATNACYELLREWNYNAGGFPIFDIMSDDARKGSNPGDASTSVGPYDNFTHTTTQDGIDRYWNTLYVGVKRTNVVITQVGGIAMDEEMKTRYIAEARFLRAVFYFDLLRSWGGVPLVTNLTPPIRLPRASTGQVDSLIIADLSFAIDHLPLKSQYLGGDLGRATKGAAQSLFARFYLFHNDFVNAAKYALDVIQSGEYGLEPLFLTPMVSMGTTELNRFLRSGQWSRKAPGSGGNQYANTQGVRGTPNGAGDLTALR